MMWAVVLNTVMALGFLITLLFCIGDVEAAITTPTGFPTIQILYQATGSKAGATIIECMILLSTMIALFGVFASVSRLTWAFARDNGLPFSDFFAHVSSVPNKHEISGNYTILTSLSVPGPPNTTHPTELPRPGNHHCRINRAHQHRQHHRLLRDPLARDDGPVPLLRDPPRICPHPQTAGQTPTLWALPPRHVEHPDQHRRPGVWNLHRHLPPLPRHAARHCNDDELRLSYPRRHHDRRPARLVHQRPQALRGPDQHAGALSIGSGALVFGYIYPLSPEPPFPRRGFF